LYGDYINYQERIREDEQYIEELQKENRHLKTDIEKSEQISHNQNGLTEGIKKLSLILSVKMKPL